MNDYNISTLYMILVTVWCFEWCPYNSSIVGPPIRVHILDFSINFFQVHHSEAKKINNIVNKSKCGSNYNRLGGVKMGVKK